ncbi:MAG TPA: allantoinase AllB [Pyrinomonadaceae bacterium]|nr:allantoinase AllB [Pyrinomonadaceae bacterium]
MPDIDLVIRGQRVGLPDEAEPAPASVHIKDGKIARVSDFNDVPSQVRIEEAEDAVVFPGLVDTHVHINEPGRTAWEGFATATRAAAAGGVTTLIDMPLNSIPPTTTHAGLMSKTAVAKAQCFVDVGFWGGVVPGNTNELEELIEDGVVGFKCFLIHSGVDEFPNVTESDLRVAMPELTRLNAMLIVHAEVPGPIDHVCSLTQAQSDTGQASDYQAFLKSRPRAAENEAVDLIIRLSREFGTRVHIVHHSSADALPALRAAKADGIRLTAETCPHYLYFAAEDIPPGATEFKCCPPIRERENREQLWEALRDGTLDFVVSDHSPCTEDLKLKQTGNFLEAWGGIASLQLRLPIMWTAARQRNFSYAELLRWLCSAPAQQVGLAGTKGAIAAGGDADIIFWNPNREIEVQPEEIHHRNKLTPYRGELLQGVVQKTFLRGRKIYDGGEFLGEPGGNLLRPTKADRSG